MKRILKKIAISSFLTMVVTIGITAVLILYPQNLFAKKIEYKHFIVHSDKPFSDDFKPLLDKAWELIKDSELYEDMDFHIVLADSSLYKQIDTRLFGLAMARSLADNVILKVHVYAEDNLLIGPKNKRDLTKTIAHEMVHCLQFRKSMSFS